MGKLLGNIAFTGRLGTLTAYKMKGCEQLIIRSRGGASKERIKRERNFAGVRKNNKEFGACSKAGKSVRRTLAFVSKLADYNISGYLNAIAKKITILDQVNPWGKRAIRFSQHHQLLDGFSLNRELPFNSIVRYPVTYSIFRDTGSATVVFPKLIAGINFYPPHRYSLFQFVVSLGVVPDWVCVSEDYQHEDKWNQSPERIYTEWLSTKETAAEQIIDLQLTDFQKLKDSHTIVLSIGIVFGYPLSNNIVKDEENAGAAIILATG